MKTPNDAPTEALVWYVGDLSLESDVRQTFLIVGKRFNLAIEVIVISDMGSLSYHRPRAPSVAALLCLPLTSTWSRARHRSPKGPPPTRTSAWLWGVPWLTPGHRHSTDRDNDNLKLCLLTFDAVSKGNAAAALLFPEQLGSTEGDRPASPWDLQEIRDWAQHRQLWRLAFRQCEMGDAANPRPTGALVNVSLRHPSFYRGWPKLRRRSDGTWSYEGPLPSNCTCSRKTSHGSTATATSSTPLESPALSCWAELLLARGTESGLRGLPSGWGSASQGDSQQASRHSDGEGSDDTWVPEEDIESEVQDLAGGPRDGHLCRELGIRTDLETNSYKQASGGWGSFCLAVSSLVCPGPRT